MGNLQEAIDNDHVEELYMGDEIRVSICPSCNAVLHEEDAAWFLPHESGKDMIGDGWVCSDACATKWLYKHWTFIADWELKKTEKMENKQ